jgi:AcrR family transcriptional regulator
MGRKSLKMIRQKEIIKTFYKVAKKEGLENASIAKTAIAMNINPSLILHYFQTKEQLIYGLIEYIMDKYLLIYRVGKNEENDPKAILLMAINNIFSKKWNTLFDDGVSYSCYSMAFRDKEIKKKYKILLDKLRKTLECLIIECTNKRIISVKDPAFTADLIFLLVDGAYYYLSLVDDKKEYQNKLQTYKQQAIKLLSLHDFASLGLS